MSNYGEPYDTAIELQRVLASVVKDPKTENKDRASCARAWEVLEERKRILRNKPLPGAYKPKAAKARVSDVSVSPIALPEPAEPATTDDSQGPNNV